MDNPTCDWCRKPATTITRHERKSSTVSLVAYWCDDHKPNPLPPDSPIRFTDADMQTLSDEVEPGCELPDFEGD